jgi:outer membrane lipoprotein SlyB
MVEGGEGLVKWGVGKAVGALVGACFGGPVGAVAGMAIGCGVDFLLDQGQKIFDNSELKQDMINTVASAQRGSPSTTFAFAPQ